MQANFCQKSDKACAAGVTAANRLNDGFPQTSQFAREGRHPGDRLLFDQEMGRFQCGDQNRFSKIFDAIYEITLGNPFAIRRILGHLRFKGFTIEQELESISTGRHDLFTHLHDADWRVNFRCLFTPERLELIDHRI